MEMGDKTARVLETRQKVIEVLRQRGPSLPIHISKATGVSMIFAGAFLSELISEKQVKISHMKVGGSPLYLLPGQEHLLENFSHFLGNKEREAFSRLRDEKILRDDLLEPAYRVALRSIKDFAEQILVRQKLEGVEKEYLFWRYFLHPEGEAKRQIENILEPKKERKEEKKDEKKEADKKKEAKDIKEKKEYKPDSVKETRPIDSVKEAERMNDELLPVQKEILGSLPAAEEKKVEKHAFIISVEEFLKNNGIILLEEKGFSKKEYECIVEVATPIGGMKFYAIAKDKKLIAESDLVPGLQKAQALRLPALFLAQGKLNKKAQEYLDKWHAFLKFKRIE